MRYRSLVLPGLSLLCLPFLLTCKPPVPSPEPEAGPQRAALRTPAATRSSDERPGEAKEPRPRQEPQLRPFQRCFAEDGPLTPPRPLGALLDRAADLYEQAGQLLRSHHEGSGAGLPPPAESLLDNSLLCADEAARTDPRAVEAHYGRAIALLELGQLDAARDAFSRALALDPDDVKSLAGAADLYINHLPPGADHTETGLEYARRGSRRARRLRDKALIGRLSLLEGQALNDLG